MMDVILDTILDVLKLIPFLFIAFLLIELIEHKFSTLAKKVMAKSGQAGPVVGSLLGAVPQCGFSVFATNLYITRIISLGTLIAIYLSTSDEMIPILLSSQVPIKTIIGIVGLKVIIGMIFGFLIDIILRKKEKVGNFHLCEHEHCHCEDSLWKSVLSHTLKTVGFLFIVTFLLNLAFAYLEESIIEHFFLKNSLFASFITSLFGLIPNCAASVILTELYVKGMISFGATMAGLLTGSGVALLVLLKNSENKMESLKIYMLLYGIGVSMGIIIDFVGLLG